MHNTDKYFGLFQGIISRFI